MERGRHQRAVLVRHLQLLLDFDGARQQDDALKGGLSRVRRTIITSHDTALGLTLPLSLLQYDFSFPLSLLLFQVRAQPHG